jgi:tryptophan synthase alpha subunit
MLLVPFVGSGAVYCNSELDLADGQLIKLSHERAIAGAMNLAKRLDVAVAARRPERIGWMF